jgi:hypothetical protein
VGSLSTNGSSTYLTVKSGRTVRVRAFLEREGALEAVGLREWGALFTPPRASGHRGPLFPLARVAWLEDSHLADGLKAQRAALGMGLGPVAELVC